MELKVNEYQLPEQILFNYEELKAELTEKVQHYETLVYTDDQIKEAKADRATLNKLKKALSDERILQTAHLPLHGRSQMMIPELIRPQSL